MDRLISLGLAIGLFGLASCTGADRQNAQKAEAKSEDKIVLLGFKNFGKVKLEDLKDVIVTGKAEDIAVADVSGVWPREGAKDPGTFGVAAGKYQGYRVKGAEKEFLGLVFTKQELPAGTRIKNLRSTGWVRLDGQTNGGVGSMTKMPAHVMEGILVSP